MARQLTPEEIGTALGRLARRIDQWKDTKAELLAEAERLAGLARGLVNDLREHGTDTVAHVRRGGRPKGMKLSEATKAKLRAAWKRRKAASKKTTGRSAVAAVASPTRKVAKAKRRGGRPKGMKLSEETKAKLRAAWKRRKAATSAKRSS